MDIVVTDMHALPRQICIHSQVLSDPYICGEPLGEDWDRVLAFIVAVHPPPLQGGLNISCIDGCIVPKHLESSNRFVSGAKGCLYLMGALRDIAAGLGQHFLFLCLLPVQMAMECLTRMLLFLLLLLLGVGGLIAGGDKDMLIFFLSRVALAVTTSATMPVCTSAAPDQFFSFPGGGLGMLVRILCSRRQGVFGMSSLIAAGIHLWA